MTLGSSYDDNKTRVKNKVFVPPQKACFLLLIPFLCFQSFLVKWHMDRSHEKMHRVMKTVLDMDTFGESQANILVLYHFFGSNSLQRSNLQFFLENGLLDSNFIHYWFFATRGLTMILPKRANVRVHSLESDCSSFVTCSLSLASTAMEVYSYFFFISSNVRGPFIPNHLEDSISWIDLMVREFNSQVKMVSSTVKCANQGGRLTPHLDSSFFVLDKMGLEIMLRQGVIESDLPRANGKDVDKDELFSLVLDAGYDVHVLQIQIRSLSWFLRNVTTTFAKDIAMGNVEGRIPECTNNRHPFEVLFVSFGYEQSKVVDKYSRWAHISMMDSGDRFPSSSFKRYVIRHAPHINHLKSRRLRLHIVTHSLEMQGAPIVLFELAKYLLGTKRYVITVSSLHLGKFRELWLQNGISLNVLSDDILTKIKLEAEANDVTLINTIGMAHIIESLPPRLLKRTIWAIQESESNAFESHFLEINRTLLRFPTRVLFGSHATRAFYSNIDFGNFRTISSWINVSQVRDEVVKRRGEMRRRLGIPNDSFLITSIGTICERNDQLTLLDAFKQMLWKNKDLKDSVRLILVGKDGTAPKYEDIVYAFIAKYQLGRNVIIEDATHDVLLYLADTSLYVSSSRYESMPINIMEAMAAGVPIVSTSSFGVFELITHGKDGILFKPKDAKSLRNILEESITSISNATRSHKWRQMALTGFETIEKYAHPQKSFKAYETLFNDVYTALANPVKSVNKVCIIVRTMYRHAEGFYTLEDMLKSLVEQEHNDWEAIVINVSSEPFPAIQKMIAMVGDLRIRLAIFNHSNYAPMMEGYDLTDIAIKHCSREASWLLVTEGNYRYLPTFLSQVDPSVDVVASDWYGSTFHFQDQAKFGRLCARWQWGGCVHNTLRIRETDLGANLLNLEKWRRENRTLGSLPLDMDQGSRIIDLLTYDEWTISYTNRCLFHQNPNPFSCHEFGGTWLETTHSCISSDQARNLLKFPSHFVYQNALLNFTCIQEYHP